MGPPQARIDEDGSSNSNAFGRLLKGWRGRRGFSQLDLAVAARTTQRHLSFIESGRAKPSREMILRLSTTMGLSLRQQNALMLAAGYAPVWRERDLSAPDLAVVNGALDYMLGQHEPYPAFVIDRCWNLRRANKGALNLTEFLTGAAPLATPSEPINLAADRRLLARQRKDRDMIGKHTLLRFAGFAILVVGIGGCTAELPVAETPPPTVSVSQPVVREVVDFNADDASENRSESGCASCGGATCVAAVAATVL